MKEIDSRINKGIKLTAAGVVFALASGGAIETGLAIGEQNKAMHSENNLQAVTEVIGDPEIPHVMQEAPIVMFPPRSPEAARAETALENKIEDLYGIEILDIREAYAYLGRKDFDLNNKND